MSKQSKSLQESLEEFEAIVDWFDREDIDIDQAIAKFEEATVISDNIKQQLTEAKNKVEVVKNKFESRRSNNINIEDKA